MYGNGIEKEEKKAFGYMEMAYDLGCPTAGFYLGCWYRMGLYVKQDTKRAISYFKDILSEQLAYAAYQMAEMYITGEGNVEQDKEAALYYYQYYVKNEQECEEKQEACSFFQEKYLS